MASLHPLLPMTGSKPSFSPWLQGQVREHIFSLTPYAQCGSVPGPQQVVTKYILKWYMNNISPHHGFKMISGNDKKKKNRTGIGKNLTPLAGFMSIQHFFRGSSPLPGCLQTKCPSRRVHAPAVLLQDRPLPAAIEGPVDHTQAPRRPNAQPHVARWTGSQQAPHSSPLNGWEHQLGKCRI